MSHALHAEGGDYRLLSPQQQSASSLGVGAGAGAGSGSGSGSGSPRFVTASSDDGDAACAALEEALEARGGRLHARDARRFARGDGKLEAAHATEQRQPAVRAAARAAVNGSRGGTGRRPKEGHWQGR